MGLRFDDTAPLPRKRWGARVELALQMRPLEFQLAPGLADRLRPGRPGNLAHIKPVTAALRFVRERLEKSGNRRQRIRRGAEPQELRMVPVAARRAAENLLR